MKKKATSTKLYSNVSQELLKKGKNKKRRGGRGRGLTLARILEGHIQKGKEMVMTWKD
jgi:hypothetical protein